MKNYVKTYKCHDVPDGAAHFNSDNHLFYNKDKTEFRSTAFEGASWIAVSNTMNANAAIELPLQDLPNWDYAPEWADRLMTCRFVDYWCSVERYTEVGLNTDSDLFKVGGVTIGDLALIEMRPIAIEDKEWLPVVGEECEVSNFGNVFEAAEVLFMGKEICIVNHPHFRSLEQHYHLSSVKFRPLKTAEELEREAFDSAVYKELYKIELDLDCVGDRKRKEKAIANILFKAGFTAPKGEG